MSAAGAETIQKKMTHKRHFAKFIHVAKFLTNGICLSICLKNDRF
jgi:hypothetical protein